MHLVLQRVLLGGCEAVSCGKECRGSLLEPRIAANGPFVWMRTR